MRASRNVRRAPLMKSEPSLQIESTDKLRTEDLEYNLDE